MTDTPHGERGWPRRAQPLHSMMSQWLKDDDGGLRAGRATIPELPPCPTVLVIAASATDREIQSAVRQTRAGLEHRGLAVSTITLDDMHCGHPMDGRDHNLDLRVAWLSADGVIAVGTPDSLASLPERLAVGQAPASGYLGDRAYGLVLAGRERPAGELARTRLERWMDSLGMIDSASFGRLDLYFGYSRADEGEAGAEQAVEHDGRRLDEEVDRVTQAMCNAVTELRAGRLPLLQRQPPTGWLPA